MPKAEKKERNKTAAKRTQRAAYDDFQLNQIAAHTTRFLTRVWFDGRFGNDAQLYMVRLLIGIFLCYRDGSLPTKKQAMKYMNAVDGRTSQRYLGLAEKEGLLRIVQSSVDKRVDLLCPTDALLTLVKEELAKIADEIRLTTKFLSTDQSPETVATMLDQSEAERLSDPYTLRSEQVHQLIADQEALPTGKTAVFWRKKIAECSEAIRLAPGNSEYWHERAQAYILVREFPKAEADCNEAIRLNRNDIVAYVVRAMALRLQGKYDRAIADLDEVIRIDPDAGLAYRIRSDIYLEIGDMDKWQADFPDALDKEAAFNDKMRRLLGDRAGSRSQSEAFWKQKIAHYSETIRLASHNPAGWQKRADAYAKMAVILHVENAPAAAHDANRKSISDYTEAIRLKPDEPRYYFWRAQVYASEMDYDNAIVDYSHVIKLGSKWTFAHFYRGRMHFLKGDLEKAREDLRDAEIPERYHNMWLEIDESLDTGTPTHFNEDAIKVRRAVEELRSVVRAEMGSDIVGDEGNGIRLGPRIFESREEYETFIESFS